MEENIVSLNDIFQILKRKWKIILVFALTSTLVASRALFLLITPQYESTTKVFIGKEESQQEGHNILDIQMYQKLLKNYAEIIKTEDLVKKAIDKTGLEIKYKSSSPEEAMKLVSSIKDEFVKLSTELVPNGNVQVIEEPRFPLRIVSPNKRMGLIVAIVLGVFMGIGVIFLMEFMDNAY